ncbi:MAG: hypothetical protein J1F40_06800 [Prevotellaceae bacterium]|nr:hypothetical protein [Prevotellaceae bacterium]
MWVIRKRAIDERQVFIIHSRHIASQAIITKGKVPAPPVATPIPRLPDFTCTICH